MKYAYSDLGVQERGNTVVVTVRGGASGVMLLDRANFARYRADRSFYFTGGRYRGSPVRLEIPEDGPWYVVLELSSHNGRGKATVEVLKPKKSSADPEPEHTLIEV